MDSFSYTDNVRAAIASCLPCFAASRSESASSLPPNALNTSLSVQYSTSSARPSSSPNDLEHLLRDSDSDGISLHSNLGVTTHPRSRRRQRPKFSLTLFGYTLFGRPPIYLPDDEEDDDGMGSGRTRAFLINSSSTLDSDAALLDASTIERLTSPDHIATLAAQRESGRRLLEAEEEARRKAERKARKQERKARARAEALMSLTGASSHPDTDVFEGFQGSVHQAVEVAPDYSHLDRLSQNDDFDASSDPHSGDADDVDLGGEPYTRKKPSRAVSGTGSDSRSRTSISLSAGEIPHIQNPPAHVTHQSIPYPLTQMHLPSPIKKPHRTSKRTSTTSSATSQSASITPYTPPESIAETPAVAASPIPRERYIRDGEHSDFPSVGLSGKRRSKALDPRAFIAHQG